MLTGISAVAWLEAWYVFWCDGDWEHQYGLTLITLPDRAGWKLEADLADTQFENCEWEGITTSRRHDDWFSCRAEASKFLAEGGVWNLAEMINSFRLWSQGSVPPARKSESPTRFLSDLPPAPTSIDSEIPASIYWLEWLHREGTTKSDGFAEIELSTLDNPGWRLVAKFATPQLPKTQGSCTLTRGWIEWSVNDAELTIYSGPANLQELIEKFKAIQIE